MTGVTYLQQLLAAVGRYLWLVVAVVSCQKQLTTVDRQNLFAVAVGGCWYKSAVGCGCYQLLEAYLYLLLAVVDRRLFMAEATIISCWKP
jgi:hypothetical protein